MRDDPNHEIFKERTSDSESLEGLGDQIGADEEHSKKMVKEFSLGDLEDHEGGSTEALSSFEEHAVNLRERRKVFDCELARGAKALITSLHMT